MATNQELDDRLDQIGADMEEVRKQLRRTRWILVLLLAALVGPLVTVTLAAWVIVAYLAAGLPALYGS